MIGSPSTLRQVLCAHVPYIGKVGRYLAWKLSVRLTQWQLIAPHKPGCSKTTAHSTGLTPCNYTAFDELPIHTLGTHSIHSESIHFYPSLPLHHCGSSTNPVENTMYSPQDTHDFWQWGITHRYIWPSQYCHRITETQIRRSTTAALGLSPELCDAVPCAYAWPIGCYGAEQPASSFYHGMGSKYR